MYSYYTVGELHMHACIYSSNERAYAILSMEKVFMQKDLICAPAMFLGMTANYLFVCMLEISSKTALLLSLPCSHSTNL